MEQPIRFQEYSNLLFRLKKSLYSLKQAPRAWYEKIVWFFLTLAFKHCELDNSICVLHHNGDTLIVALYVDDLIITGNNVDLILGLKKHLVDTFEMIYLGLVQYFFGIHVLQMNDSIFLSQPKYVLDLLKKNNMDD